MFRPTRAMRLLCSCGFAVVVMLSVTVCRAEVNLVANPGFEKNTKSQGSPAGWSVSWRKTRASDENIKSDSHKPDFKVTDSEPRSGSQSVRIGIDRPADDLVLTAPLIAVEAGTKIYRASVWVKAANLKEMTARLCAVYLGDNGKWLGADYGVCVVQENTTWKQCVGLFQPARGTRNIRLRLWTNFERKGTGVVWWDDVSVTSTTFRKLPPLQYLDSTPVSFTESERSRGYRVFSRPMVETIYPSTKPRPDDKIEQLMLESFAGEIEAASFCIHTCRELAQLTWEVTPLHHRSGATIPRSSVRMYPVRCLVRQGQSRWGPLANRPMVQPVYIQQSDRVAVAADTTQQLWVTLSVPKETPAGEYCGSILLKTAETRWSMPMTLTVYPFELPDVPGIAFGMYARIHPDQKLLEQNFLDMRRHGMTTVGVCGNLGAKLDLRDGRVDVQFGDEDDLVRAVRAYQKAGFPEPLVWLMGSDILRWCRRQGPLESKQFESAYRDILLAILRFAKQNDWPEIIFQPIDEPFGHSQRMPEAKRCLEIMKSIPGLRTEEDGPNGGPELVEQVYSLCDVLVYHDGPWVTRTAYDPEAWQQLLKRTRADGKTIWFYNVDLTGYHPEAMRFGYGFGMFAGQGRGLLEWAYMFRYRPDRPDEAYTNPKVMFFRYPTTDQNVGGPSIGWEAAREGVKDYKLLCLFLETVRDAKASGGSERRELAERLDLEVKSCLARIRFEKLMATAGKGHFTGPTDVRDDGVTTVSGSFKMDNGWTFADYGKLRRLLADAVVQLAKSQPNVVIETGRSVVRNGP